MNLKRLQICIAQYKRALRKKPLYDPVYQWESLKIFQENWDIDALNFAEMYDLSLQNSITKRLWKRENYEPKSMMLKLISIQPDFVRYMFKDLFSEEKDIVGRVDRFVFHCDELLREYKDSHPRSIENNHYHDDGYQIISLYLSFRYPENYAPYHFTSFQRLMEKIGSMDIPRSSDFGRFCKVSRTLYKLLSKEEEVMARHKKRLNPDVHFQGETLLLVEDFIHTIAS